jgi:P-type Ca2+ transporter type 2C
MLPGEMPISVVQGIVISITVLALYYFFMQNNFSTQQTQTIVFTTLILSNVFLTFANRSFIKTMFYTLRYKNNLALALLVIAAAFLIMLHFIPAVCNLLQAAGFGFALWWPLQV